MDIIHRVGIKASPREIYQALTTDKGLANWWTSNTQGANGVGSVIDFRFNENIASFEVIEMVKDIFVKWRYVSDSPEDWVGTEITFEIQAKHNQSFVNFKHADWQQQTNLMSHCSLKWAVFILSLKDYLETGKGRPFPNDIQIDHD